MPGDHSRSYKGPKNNSPVVPSWMDDCGHCHGTGRVIGIHEHRPGVAIKATGDYYIECPACRGTGQQR
jgi:hypothetical protein